jgi:hypothetical protein
VSVWINGIEYDSKDIARKILLVRRIYFWLGWAGASAVIGAVHVLAKVLS